MEGNTADWCNEMQEKALKEGNTKDAKHYEELSRLWKEREDKKVKEGE